MVKCKLFLLFSFLLLSLSLSVKAAVEVALPQNDKAAPKNNNIELTRKELEERITQAKHSIDDTNLKITILSAKGDLDLPNLIDCSTNEPVKIKAFQKVCPVSEKPSTPGYEWVEIRDKNQDPKEKRNCYLKYIAFRGEAQSEDDFHAFCKHLAQLEEETLNGQKSLLKDLNEALIKIINNEMELNLERAKSNIKLERMKKLRELEEESEKQKAAKLKEELELKKQEEAFKAKLEKEKIKEESKAKQKLLDIELEKKAEIEETKIKLQGKEEIRKAKKEHELKELEKREDHVRQGELEKAKHVQQVELEKAKSEARVQKIKAQGEANAAAFKQNLEATFEKLKKVADDPAMAAKLTAYSGGAALTLTAAYYGVRYVYQYKMSTMHKPSLVRESSLSFSLKEILRKFFARNQNKIDLNEIVLPPAIKEQVHRLAQAAKRMHNCGLPFENLLIYGPPGTGKTAFIKLLAKYSDMDYVILSGADFCQFKNGEGITELHKLFDLARNSKNGLVIFIDEADACFRNRLEASTDLVNLINAFLAETGESSKKAMVALATNYDGTLDSAVRSRMHNKIAFMLPSEKERLEIFNLKIKKNILDHTRIYKTRQGKVINEKFRLSSELDEPFWKNIAKITEGFSGRDIDFAVQAMRRELQLDNTSILTPEIVSKVINEKINEVTRNSHLTQTQKALYEQRTGVSLEY